MKNQPKMDLKFDWMDKNIDASYVFQFWSYNNAPHVSITRHDKYGEITMTSRTITKLGACICDEDTWISDGAKQCLNRLIQMRSFW